MVEGYRAGGPPRSAIVVGAGIVGLSTAWFLQERGVRVTVVDRIGVAAGASWGNAGYIAPALAIPLNEARILRYGLRSLLNPTSPVRITPSIDPALWRFLARFAANSRRRPWKRAARANVTLNEQCIDAYDELAANGVDAPVHDAPITAMFRDPEGPERLLDELRHLGEAGEPVSTTELTGAELREQVPLASEAVIAVVRINNQRFVEPGRFLQALGTAVVERGAVFTTADISDVREVAGGAAVQPRSGPALTADVAVVATGAWLSPLVRRWIRVPVQAGRGYSFSVPVQRPVPCPVYMPDDRVACAPGANGTLHVTGTMELHSADAPASTRRIEVIADSARPLLDGVDWERRSDDWVGARPLSPDGRPLVGQVSGQGSAGVYVAGGHGMWGMTHGPVTGRLLAEQITTGRRPDALRDLDPRR